MRPADSEMTQDLQTGAVPDVVPAQNYGMYDTDYQVECQTLFMEHFEEHLNFRFDADLYFAGLKDTLAARESHLSPSAGNEKSPFYVVDLGTGPGHCLRDLGADATRAGLPISFANFIGIDRSPAQLRRAATLRIEGPASVSWACGDASSFAALPELAGLRSSIDYMILFNLGSILHLVEPGEPEAMFAQVAALLRPGSGRAYLSLQDENILSRSLTTPKDLPDWYDELEWEATLVSKAYPGVRYHVEKQSPTQQTGRLMRRTTTMSVYRKTAGGQGEEELVKKDPVDITLLCWEEKDLVKCIEDAGLKVVKTVEGTWQTYYMIMLQ